MFHCLQKGEVEIPLASCGGSGLISQSVAHDGLEKAQDVLSWVFSL